MPKRHAIILAAGKGTRFKSNTPKIMHRLCGKPLMLHVLDKLQDLQIGKTFLVVNQITKELEEALSPRRVQFIEQGEQLGTGHALLTAAPQFKGLTGNLLVLCADTPLIRVETLQQLMETCEEQNADQVLLTTSFDDPSGYGRILRDEKGEAIDIVEEKEASPEQITIREINTGVICLKISSLLKGLPELTPSEQSGEYYLTDLLSIQRGQGKKVITLTTDHPDEARGVNDREQLSVAEMKLRDQIARRWMRNGVTFLNPSAVYIDDSVAIGPDTVIYPGVIIEGNSKIGTGCVIRSFSHLRNAILEDGVIVDHCSVIRDSSIGRQTQVGPFAHLRQNCLIGSESRIGNFVEVKQSRIGNKTKAAHLSYLGDAEVGDRVNIGAGTITCNYDGERKHKTAIEDEVFVGSGSQLVAPVTLHQKAYVAAGSTITQDIPENSLGVARQRQINKLDWTKSEAKKD